jgi:transposase
MILPPTIEEFSALQQALKTTLSQRDALVGECRVLRTERDLLQERLGKFMRKIFAARTEASNQTQKDLFFVFNEAEALGAQAEPAGQEDGVGADENGVDVPAHKRARRGRKPLDAAVPREVVRHELPEAERVCPHDGAALVEIGVEASEQLDIVPQQVRVIRHERVKYACPCCDGALRLAPKPAQVIPKGLFSEGLLAWVIASKYCDGLAVVPPGRFAGTLWRQRLVAQHLGRQRRVRGPGGAAPRQPVA